MDGPSLWNTFSN